MKRTVSLSLLAVTPALAGPLPTAYIPPEAQWVVHVDVEKGLKTSVGSYITSHPGEFELDGLEAVRAKTGLDPLADIKDLTIFGASCDPDEGVALIHTTAAVDAFLERARQGEASFRQVAHGSYTLDTWTEGGSSRFGFVRSIGENERLILVAQSAERLAAAIARTETPAPGGPPCELLKQPPKSTSVVFIAARGLGSMASNPKTVMLRQAEGLVLDMGEEDSSLYATVALTTRSDQDAGILLSAMNGFVAIARMGARHDPELAGLLEATSGLSLTAEGSSVRGQMRYESQKAIDMLKESAKRRLKGAKAAEDPPAPARTPTQATPLPGEARGQAGGKP